MIPTIHSIQDLTWFHRWVGWGVVALGSVHVVFYTVWYIFLGNLWARWKDGLQHKLWFQAGFVASASTFASCTQSSLLIDYFRRFSFSLRLSCSRHHQLPLHARESSPSSSRSLSSLVNRGG